MSRVTSFFFPSYFTKGALLHVAVTERLAGIDRSRSNGKKPLLGGSLFASSSGPSTPAELQPLVPLQASLSKSAVTSSAAATAANAEYEKMNDPNYTQPTPPVLAARLSQLLKTLANAENSVSESIKSRRALIEGLEKLLETNRSALVKEQALSVQLSDRKTDTETKKREVEDRIMKGLSTAENPLLGQPGKEEIPTTSPTVEALTPPPVEAITPVGSPKGEQPQEQQNPGYSAPAAQPPYVAGGGGFALPGFGQTGGLPFSGTDLTALVDTLNNQQRLNNANSANSKKRKASHEEDYAKYAGGDLDADVAELLAQEGGKK